MLRAFALRAFPVLFIGLLLGGCDPAMLLGPSADRAEGYELRARYSRGGCYGRCEVFTLDVYDNGLLIFEGKRFSDKPGTWEKSLDRRRVAALLDTMSRADFANYPASFRGQVADASLIEITYVDRQGQRYRTSFQDTAPDELLALSQRLNDLAHLPNYRQVSDTVANRLSFRPVAEQAREEIIVELAEGVDAGAWVIAYGKQGVALERRISPRTNYYLLTADPNLMASEELLTFLRQDRQVVSAQTNKPVSPRR